MGSGSGMSPAAPLSVAAVPAAALIAGQYNGTITDSVRGSGKAVLQLTTLGANAGGSLKQTYSGKVVQGVVSLALVSTVVPNGTEVVLGSSPCTFSVSAAYNSSKHLLGGSFKAVNRCSGENGTFKLKEQCYYKTSSATDNEQPNTIGIKEC
jgi:hypothetical protein